MNIIYYATTYRSTDTTNMHERKKAKSTTISTTFSYSDHITSDNASRFSLSDFLA